MSLTLVGSSQMGKENSLLKEDKEKGMVSKTMLLPLLMLCFQSPASHSAKSIISAMEFTKQTAVISQELPSGAYGG